MPSAFELLDAAQPAAPEAAPVDNSPGQFQQGLRSGLSGAYSQLEALGGGVAEAAGMPGVAETAYEGARRSRADAEANAPRVSSYKDVHDLRSGYDYVTGLLGQSLPQAAASVAGGLAARTPAGRLVGATVANVPFEAGDVVQRQLEDPSAAQAPADERLLHAAGGGLASAAAQSVLPAAVAGKVAGPVAGAAERTTVGNVLAKGLRELPQSMAIEGAGNAAGEAAKQFAVDPNRPLDTDALAESFVGGAAAGVPLHAAGMAGELAHAAARAPGNTLSDVASGLKAKVSSAAQAIGDRASSAADTARTAATEIPAKVDVPDPLEAIRGIYDKGTQQARAFWDTVAKGEDTATLLAKAGETADQIKQKLPQIDADRLQKVGDAAKQLWENKGLTEDQRARLQQAMGDLSDRGNQAVVAGLKRGQEMGQEFAGKARDLFDAFSQRVKGAVEGDGTKKSEDFSGADQAVAETILPLVQEANPDIFTSPEALHQAGTALRMALTQMREGQDLTSTQIARLIDAFGNHATSILEAAHRTLHGTVGGAEREDFYRGLKAVNDYAGRGDRVQDFMMKTMKPELQDTVRASDVKQELEHLRATVERARSGSAEAAFKLDQLRADMQDRYGKNADKILAMIEKEQKPQANVLDAERVKTDAESGEVLSREGHGLTVAEGAGRDGTVYYGPEKGGLTTRDSAQALAAAERAKKQHPGYEPMFVSAEQLGHQHPEVQRQLKELQAQFVQAGKSAEEAAQLAREAVRHYGMMAVVKTEMPGHVTKDNVRQVMVKGDGTKKVGRSHYDQPSVFKVEGAAYDAIALTKLMERQFKGEFTAEDDKSAIHRNARMFMEGVGALQDHLGKHFEVPDSLVIDHQGTTVADVKKLGFAPPNRAAEVLDAHLRALRKAYNATENPNERAKLRAEAQDAIDRAKAFDPRMDIPDVKEEGTPDADPFGNVHEALKGVLEPKPEQAIRTNMTGNSREKDQGLGGALPKDEETAAKSGAVKGTSDVLREKLQAWVDKPPSAAAKAIAEKGLALLDNKAVLSGPDKKGLAALLSSGTKASQVAGTINALYEKYKGKIEGGASKLPVAEAKPVARGEAANDNIINFANKRSEKTMERARELIQSLSPEDYDTLQNDTLTRDWSAGDKMPTALKDSFREWLRDNYSAMEREERMAPENIDETHRSFYEETAEYGEGLEAALAAAKLTGAKLGPREGAKVAEPKTEALADHAIDRDFAKEHYPEFETAAEAKKYLLDAYRRWGELAAEERRVMNDDDHPTNELPEQQRQAFARLSEMFAGDSHADLGSFLPGQMVGADGASDTAIRAYLKKSAPEVAGQVPKYFRSLEGTGAGRVDAQAMKDVRAYVDKVLGPQVKTALEKIPHAGEYVNDTIRISVHALNPTTVAYHEALHAFFDKLSKQGNSDVARVLEKAALSAPIQNQLRKLLASEHAALAQLRDPEEAAAYMYQFWAAGKLKVGGATGNIFARVKEAIAKVLGVWTNDRRAEAIMDYFHSGEFKTQGLGQPNAVARALLQAGRNEILEKAKRVTKPLAEVADAIGTAGAQRLRDTGVPALRELADLMKVTGREASDDHGFIPTARIERTRVMNELGAKLRGFTSAHIDDALEAMQSGGQATTPEGRLVQRAVQGKDGLLPTMLEYMRQAGVDVGKVQPRQDYFPRLYDAHYISRHQAEFQAVLEKHGLSAKEAEAITLNLMATNGAEFTVETDRPGMQNLKQRSLAMIPDAELARFMRKNMFEILGSYVTQATRRAEWARRFGDDGQGITRMLDRAKAQGATPEQLETARKFVRAVDGTLGDSLSPTARRLMGNVIVYQNWRLLPLAVFSSVVDPLGIVVRGGTVRDAWSTFKRGVREIPSSWKNDFKADADTHLAATLGVIDDAMLADATSQLYMQGLVGDTAKKINDALFRFNLMEGFNRSMRVGATQAAIKFLERHADGKASPHSARWLNELGLQPGFKMDLADPKVRAAINQWVDGAVLRPDAVDKPIWMNDPHYMLVSHLKQFVYAFQETILKRVAHEFQEGNYAPAMALSAYVPVMIASDLLKGMIQGGGQLPDWKQDWGPADYLGSGIERAGLLGKAQFPLDGAGMMLGPTGQQAMSVAEALDGKAPGKAFLKALPGETLYSGWVGGGGSRVENSMSVD